MRLRALGRAMVAISLSAGTLVCLAAPAAAADSCPSSDPLVGSASGTVTQANPDWFALTTTTRAAVTMVPSSGDPDMKIVGAGCSPVVCYPYRGGTETCVVAPGTYHVGLLYYSGSGGVASYSLTVSDGQCVDGLDNDGDGRVDYPNDPGCTGYDDSTESVACSTTNGHKICAGSSTAGVWVRQGVRPVTIEDGPSYSVAGYVDDYRFTLPGGGTATLACVVLVTGETTSNPCADAGGELVGLRRPLVEDQADQPTPAFGDEIAWAGVCQAEFVATVDGLGVNSFPGYTLCAGLETNDWTDR